jgi:hypothetical protein
MGAQCKNLSRIRSNNSTDTISHTDASWLLAVTFAGLGSGFVMLILTLSMVNAILLCTLGILVVWPLSRNKKDNNQFALESIGIYYASAIVGVTVGWASTFGTGLPVGSIEGSLVLANILAFIAAFH